MADYPPGATFGPRRVSDYELVWLLSGSARWIRQDLGPDRQLGDERELTLRPGTLALARPGSRDAYRWDSGRPSRHGYVHFSVEPPVRWGPECDWPAVQSTAAEPVLDGLSGYLMELSGLSSIAARARTEQIVALILDIFLTGPRPAAPDDWPESLQVMVDYVRQDWTEHGMRAIEVTELAVAAHLSSGHLYRLFRQRTGLGPAHALELVRLARAAITLQRSNAPLSTVAETTGFANAYHFSRRFRGAYGSPPGAFRRRQEAVDPLGPIRRTGLTALAQRLL